MEAPRFASQSVTNSFYPRTYLPGHLDVEAAIPQDTRTKLSELGHKVGEFDPCGYGAVVSPTGPINRSVERWSRPTKCFLRYRLVIGKHSWHEGIAGASSLLCGFWRVRAGYVWWFRASTWLKNLNEGVHLCFSHGVGDTSDQAGSTHDTFVHQAQEHLLS